MRFGIEFVPLEPYWRTVYYSIQAERLGYDNIWITDHFNNRNVYVLLSTLANYTERITLGPGVTNPYLIHPVITAQSIASLSEIAPGRIALGIGAGDKTTLEMVGVEQKSPLTAVREAVELIRRQLARAKEGYSGSIFKTSPSARFNFRVQGGIPIYIGAQGPRMLQLAGSVGDGVLINACHPEDVASAIKSIREGAEMSGRKLEELDIAAYTSFSIADDEGKAYKAAIPVVAYIVAGSPPPILSRHGIAHEAAERIRSKLAERKWEEAFREVTHEMIESFSIAGTPERCIGKIQELLEKGITQFVVGSPLGPNMKEAINLFGRRIIPHFRE
ncbi:MAG: 5,10-methylenetetrahydromethanopterin reductase [Candidatus Bathyarchaeia archaeon]